MRKNKLFTVSKRSDGPTAEMLALLAGEYETVFLESEDDCIELLKKDGGSCAAVLEELSFALSSGCRLLDFVRSEPYLAEVPVIAITESEPSNEETACFERGFADLFTPPMHALLLRRRLRNAIRSSNSMTFSDVEKLLKELPSCIFLKDKEGKYVFSTQIWHHLNADEPGWTIRGKTDIEIRKDKANAQKAMEADKRILATGVGTSYIIEEKDGDIREFLELIKRPTFDANGEINGIIAVINDVTNEHLLRLELEQRSRTDPLTGLNNKSAVQDLVALMLQKSGGERCSLLLIDIDDFKAINDTYGHAMGDRVLSTVGGLIKNSLSGSDFAGRVGGDEFMVFLADTPTAASACDFAEKLEEAVLTTFGSEYRIGRLSLSIGVAVFPDDGNTFMNLYKAADHALYSVKRSGKGSWKLFSECDDPL